MNLILTGVQRLRMKYLIDPVRFREEEAQEKRKKGETVEPITFNRSLNAVLRLVEHAAQTATSCGFVASNSSVTCGELRACEEYLIEDTICYPNAIFKNVTIQVPQFTEVLCTVNETTLADDTEVDAVELTNFMYDPEESDAEIKLSMNEEEHCYYEIRSLFWSTPDNVVPNLIIGAIYGRLMGYLVNAIRTWAAPVDPGIYAMIGMAAFWSGTSRLVVTVVLVVLELTGDMGYLPALIIACFSAAWVGGAMGEGLYHMEMENNGAPYLPSNPAHILKTIETSKIMASRLYILRRLETVRGIRRLLLSCKFEGFPIVETYHYDEDGEEGQKVPVRKFRAIGYVRRNRLEELVAELTAAGVAEHHVVELESVSSSNPVVVREDTTASKVFRMFRQLGLKHVFVSDRDGFLVGMVTRHDLLRPSVVEEEEKRRRGRDLGDLARDLLSKFEDGDDEADTDSDEEENDNRQRELQQRGTSQAEGKETVPPRD
ncbi:hypothetical protein HK405_013087 [Cladochytrium tenue]|nr:hypothetical protein HK405_013087 [Cladochytrium tenue]